jgi:cytochrome c oxidase cbb3-type subunit I/II
MRKIARRSTETSKMELSAQSGAGKSPAALRVDEFTYDDATPRAFLLMTAVWGLVAMLAGLLAALELAAPVHNMGLPFTSFGRLRPLHTSVAIIGFAGNAIFAAIYYSTQRLSKARMHSDFLSKLHFWGWQAIIVAAAVTLPLGFTQGKEYAELEWPIDIAVAAVWLAFAVNFFGTLARRRERHMYISLWFYIATIVGIAVLHIVNSVAVPVGPLKSYSIHGGVRDAFMEWWYGHNAIEFLLTMPFLGLMYYFLPKAAERPVFSYRLSFIHFWSLLFITIGAGPRHLHYTALPEWASTMGMIFSVMLWMPSWGGMLNGFLTLRGAWDRVAADPVLKFFVVALTFYGMSTFESSLLSVKGVDALLHYTDWTIAHVHAGAMGWVGFMTFGMLYWMLPRLFQAPLYSKRLATAHFWIATAGLLLFIIPIYVAGLTEGLMWRAVDEGGRLAYPDFVEALKVVRPMYWIRALGGTLYMGGAVLALWNLLMTWRARPARYESAVHRAPALDPHYREPPPPESRLRGAAVIELAHTIDVWEQAAWHRRWEGRPLRFTVWVAVAVIVASLFEAVPMFLIRSDPIESVRPYTPLELAGRDIYLAEGCSSCHSQMVRPTLSDTKRFGEYSKPGEFVYDHPFQWGSRRIGPDLAREGGKQSSYWHYLHFQDPRKLSGASIMPAYAWLIRETLDFGSIPARLRAMVKLGVPYDEAAVAGSIEAARKQAAEVAKQIVEQKGPPGLESKKVVALISYLQRLGTDLFATPPAPAPIVPPVGAGAEKGGVR